jgi:hypothetical protein
MRSAPPAKFQLLARSSSGDEYHSLGETFMQTWGVVQAQYYAIIHSRANLFLTSLCLFY